MLQNKIEIIRNLAEEIEHLEKSITHILQMKDENQKHNCINDHKLKNMALQIQSRSAQILNLYKTESQNIQSEFERIEHVSDSSVLENQFYYELENLQNDAQNSKIYDLKVTKKNEAYFLDNVFVAPNTAPVFAIEEHNGRCFDFQQLYQQLTNNSAFESLNFGSYLNFVRDFDKVFALDNKLKEQNLSKIIQFYNHVINYFEDFYQKFQPLVDFKSFQNELENQFKENEKKLVLENPESEETPNEQFFFCEICSKYFSNENTFVHHFNGKPHKKLLQKKENPEIAEEASEIPKEEQLNAKKELKSAQVKKLRKLEFLIKEYLNLFEDVHLNTVNNIRRKSTYNPGEIQEELQEISDEELSISDKDDDEPRERRNLPIDSTGKPIPMWIFKMQGLGIEYKCEICGNYSYWGRRPFEKHFTEWRHSYGMKCLHIPNTAHFYEITSINDALIIHRKLLLEAQEQKFVAEKEEEIEDELGNVRIGKIKSN